MNNLKKTTGLTGMAVARNPVHTLTALYGKILRALGKLPECSAYRKYTEEIVVERSSIVCNSKSVCEIEEKINSGQVEELIIQAENELRLARNFVFSKPWEELIAEPPKDQWLWPPAKIS